MGVVLDSRCPENAPAHRHKEGQSGDRPPRAEFGECPEREEPPDHHGGKAEKQPVVHCRHACIPHLVPREGYAPGCRRQDVAMSYNRRGFSTVVAQ